MNNFCILIGVKSVSITNKIFYNTYKIISWYYKFLFLQIKTNNYEEKFDKGLFNTRFRNIFIFLLRKYKFGTRMDDGCMLFYGNFTQGLVVKEIHLFWVCSHEEIIWTKSSHESKCGFRYTNGTTWIVHYGFNPISQKMSCWKMVEMILMSI